MSKNNIFEEFKFSLYEIIIKLISPFLIYDIIIDVSIDIIIEMN